LKKLKLKLPQPRLAFIPFLIQQVRNGWRGIGISGGVWGGTPRAATKRKKNNKNLWIKQLSKSQVVTEEVDSIDFQPNIFSLHHHHARASQFLSTSLQKSVV
jgi:hypothetical protein